MDLLTASINNDVANRMKANKFFNSGAYVEGMTGYSKGVNELQESVSKAAEELNKQYVAAAKSGNQDAISALVAKKDSLSSAYNNRMGELSKVATQVQENAFRDVFKEKYGADFSSLTKANVNAKRYGEVVRDIADEFSGHAPLDLIKPMLSRDAIETDIKIGEKESADRINVWKIGTSGNVMLPQEFTGALLGAKEDFTIGTYKEGLISKSNDMDQAKGEFTKIWKSGAVRDVAIRPLGKAVSFVDRNGQPTQAVKAEAYIPVSSFSEANIRSGSWLPFTESRNDAIKKAFGAKIVKSPNGEYAVFDVYYPLTESVIGKERGDLLERKDTYSGNDRQNEETNRMLNRAIEELIGK
jgi:hypothetical protein